MSEENFIQEETSNSMEILVDENGYINSYNTVPEHSHIENSVTIDIPEDFEHFEVFFYCYKYEDGKLIFDEEKQKEVDLERKREAIRKQRAEECFLIVDRSRLWYETLTEAEYKELGEWYQAWLLAPETFIIPDKPSWLE